jgi:hypothetical protein
VVSFTPQLLYFQRESPVTFGPLNRGLGSPHNQSGERGKERIKNENPDVHACTEEKNYKILLILFFIIRLFNCS